MLDQSNNLLPQSEPLLIKPIISFFFNGYANILYLCNGNDF